jgi:L-lactate utilization protein LutB
MSNDLPIWIEEPELGEKRELAAWKLSAISKKAESAAEVSSIEDIKQQLKELRIRSRENIGSLVDELENNLSRLGPNVKIKRAFDNGEAVQYITDVSDGIRVVSINNSSIVSQEIKPGLTVNNFTVINSYLNEYETGEKKLQDYWDLPRLLDKNLSGTFGVSEKLDGISRSGEDGPRDYVAVLGVNAVSAADGTVFFLQHYHNILNDLKNARKVILVIGIDKIVKNREDADFQTKCMGIFGMENITLSVQPRPDDIRSIDDLELPLAGGEKELHVIILDNGRMKLLEGKFSELFLCIGCRACNKHCPIQHSFTDVDYIWTPRNYLNQFLSRNSSSIDVCLHCEACRMECPIDIDLPHLMWQAKMDYVNTHGTSFSHKILGAPERLAKLASPFAPIANLLMRWKLVRVPMELITGIDRKTTLPVFHSRTFRKRFQEHA